MPMSASPRTESAPRSLAVAGLLIGVLVACWGLFTRIVPVDAPALPFAAAGVGLAAVGFSALMGTARTAAVPLAAGLAGLVLSAVALSGQLGEVSEGVSAAMLSASFEAAGGALALSALMVWAARVPLPELPGDRPEKVRLVRPQDRTITVGSHEVGPGDVVRLAAGQKVPADGRLVSEDGLFDASALGLPDEHEISREGGVFAGWVALRSVDVKVERPPSSSYWGARAAASLAIAEHLLEPERRARWMGHLTLGLGGLALVGAWLWSPLFGRTGHPSFPRTLAILAAVALATLPSLPGLLARRQRARALEKLLGSGLTLTRAGDFERLLGVKRRRIDARALARPGTVEVLELGGENKKSLLGIAVALLADRDHPDRATLAAALRSARGRSKRGAAFSDRRGVFMGTVDGHRWYLGPPESLARQAGVAASRDLKGTLTFLQEQGRRVLLLGSPDLGLVGAFGLDMGADLELAAAARALGAEAIPMGLSSAAARQVADKAELNLSRGGSEEGDGIIIHEDSPLPQDGLPIRLAPPRLGAEVLEGPPRLFPSGFPGFPPALAAARVELERGRGKLPFALLGPVVAFAVAELGGLVPFAGLVIGAIVVGWTLRDAAPMAEEAPEPDEEEIAVDVTLSGIESVVPTGPSSSEVTIMDDEPPIRR